MPCAKRPNFCQMLSSLAIVVVITEAHGRPLQHSIVIPASPRRTLLRHALALGVPLAATATLPRPSCAAQPTRNAAELPQFDAEGKLLTAYDEETDFQVIRSGAASVRILSGWTQGADSSLADPVMGAAASRLAFSKTPTSLANISELGRAEQVQVTSAFGLDSELVRADMVAASKRLADGVLYYEYDLALPAKECVPELATACLPQQVTLLSCCVRDKVLHVLQVDISPSQWRRAGQALKNLRSTFVVQATAQSA
eukprot:CAMPEP_0119357086 /NCGR_PEP_ID=MMETSP1334-20130426/5544_1 /TAXON_ID=127549 /ORGANISM="Calcidiscus leptoporus, Strain RCC1130" /LENGTH=255 /DNA_ID=CAMNT_0007371261 /DNA_START=6 /DNA_END=773 /DNA_ORIENTATION=+